MLLSIEAGGNFKPVARKLCMAAVVLLAVSALTWGHPLGLWFPLTFAAVAVFVIVGFVLEPTTTKSAMAIEKYMTLSLWLSWIVFLARTQIFVVWPGGWRSERNLGLLVWLLIFVISFPYFSVIFGKALTRPSMRWIAVAGILVWMAHFLVLCWFAFARRWHVVV